MKNITKAKSKKPNPQLKVRDLKSRKDVTAGVRKAGKDQQE